MKQINWKKLLDDFEVWLAKAADRPRCKSCSNMSHNYPDWEDQQKEIQQLANAQVLELKNKKT